MKSVNWSAVVTEATSNPICDFCHRPVVNWRYKANTFDLPEVKWRSVGDWGACDKCAHYIEDDRLDDLAFLISGLLATQTKGFSELAGADKDGLHQLHYYWVRKLFRGFAEHKTGERVIV